MGGMGLPAMEQTHSSRVSASTSPYTHNISFFSSPSELAGQALPPWTLSDSDSESLQFASPSVDFAAHRESLGDRHLQMLQAQTERALAHLLMPDHLREEEPHSCWSPSPALSADPLAGARDLGFQLMSGWINL
ncbi:hypothetical protein QTO34_018184 [Cnephaeus nilssonii]|uniref:Endosome-associated-trafficking regulator 1 n=1 Tax=Cnephaeus nilssonii TaxID=3371016 RepID=A0AA40LNL0_CNENI|nr:hypothetical protein QTO34_018184 [Eptesicus nilssonii]